MHAILAFPQDPFTQSTQLKNKQIALSWAQNLCNKGNTPWLTLAVPSNVLKA